MLGFSLLTCPDLLAQPNASDESAAGPSSELATHSGMTQFGAAELDGIGPSNEEVGGESGTPSAELTGGQELNLLWLALRGGPLMIAIAIASLVTVAVVFERLFSLRRSRVMPPMLVQGLGGATMDGEQFDPKQAYRLCQSQPSALANIVKAMLLKVGRPHPEVEQATQEASQREANRMYRNVRWLNLVAAVAPLIGLLGTVWGMIRAFFDTTQMTAGQNKADFLAAGIYVALVTTLGGLAVAIPAAIFAHYFEGCIQNICQRIEELMFNLMPNVERYEGRLRVNRRSLSSNGHTADKSPSGTQPAPADVAPS